MLRRAILIALLLIGCAVRQVHATSATGGTVTDYTEGGTNWQAHIFTSGTNTVHGYRSGSI